MREREERERKNRAKKVFTHKKNIGAKMLKKIGFVGHGLFSSSLIFVINCKKGQKETLKLSFNLILLGIML